MRRFKEDDLAITCNSRAPLINDGHLVRILEVLGPEPELGLQFAYFIERVDGLPFTLACRAGSPMPVAGTPQLLADHSKLRRLRDQPLAEGVQTAEEAGAQV